MANQQRNLATESIFQRLLVSVVAFFSQLRELADVANLILLGALARDTETPSYPSVNRRTPTASPRCVS